MSSPPNFCFPVRELSNERIRLIPFDAILHTPSFFANTSAHPEIWAHMPMGPFTSVGDLQQNFVQVIQQDAKKTLYAVLKKSPPSQEEGEQEEELAGVIGYLNASFENLSTEIGYLITFPAFQRTHVTTNAVGLLLQYALDPEHMGGLGLRRVQWQTNVPNVASARTAERMGFMKEGLLRWDRVFADGERRGKVGNGKRLPDGKEKDLGRDTLIFGLCWDDWEDGVKGRVVALMARR
ncbi:acyl-CoA N-acyltransferase [Choiromyces venosus 120613-1]|uniref:Acyl-CoA N-acyltransferase n=1 Tax=Choiromyces venosus 120613-1 TaxID=1336337 RepID=A0A3N4JL03_9PEZI|nr:acyl-CoA N-acyltransferase [Choiromyces venosus 120613-1]